LKNVQIEVRAEKFWLWARGLRQDNDWLAILAYSHARRTVRGKSSSGRRLLAFRNAVARDPRLRIALVPQSQCVAQSGAEDRTQFAEHGKRISLAGSRWRAEALAALSSRVLSGDTRAVPATAGVAGATGPELPWPFCTGGADHCR